jgi:hypothetical protein
MRVVSGGMDHGQIVPICAGSIISVTPNPNCIAAETVTIRRSHLGNALSIDGPRAWCRKVRSGFRTTSCSKGLESITFMILNRFDPKSS